MGDQDFLSFFFEYGKLYNLEYVLWHAIGIANDIDISHFSLDISSVIKRSELVTLLEQLKLCIRKKTFNILETCK